MSPVLLPLSPLGEGVIIIAIIIIIQSNFEQHPHFSLGLPPHILLPPPRPPHWHPLLQKRPAHTTFFWEGIKFAVWSLTGSRIYVNFKQPSHRVLVKLRYVTKLVKKLVAAGIITQKILRILKSVTMLSQNKHFKEKWKRIKENNFVPQICLAGWRWWWVWKAGVVEGEDKYQMKPDLAILPMIVRNGMRRKMKNRGETWWGREETRQKLIIKIYILDNHHHYNGFVDKKEVCCTWSGNSAITKFWRWYINSSRAFMFLASCSEYICSPSVHHNFTSPPIMQKCNCAKTQMWKGVKIFADL